jgi:hypothetical protein
MGVFSEDYGAPPANSNTARASSVFSSIKEIIRTKLTPNFLGRSNLSLSRAEIDFIGGFKNAGAHFPDLRLDFLTIIV